MNVCESPLLDRLPGKLYCLRAKVRNIAVRASYEKYHVSALKAIVCLLLSHYINSLLTSCERILKAQFHRLVETP